MADITDGEVAVDGYHRRQIDLTTTVRLAADDLTKMLLELDEDHRRHVIDAISEADGLIAELFAGLDPDEQIEIAHDHLGHDELVELIKQNDADYVKELLDEFCCRCGTHVGDGRCNCMRDD